MEEHMSTIHAFSEPDECRILHCILITRAFKWCSSAAAVARSAATMPLYAHNSGGAEMAIRMKAGRHAMAWHQQQCVSAEHQSYCEGTLQALEPNTSTSHSEATHLIAEVHLSVQPL